MLKKTTSFVMSILLLIVSMNVTYGAHYCGGELVKQALMFGKGDLSCTNMAKAEKCDNEQHADYVIKRKSCCENKFGNIESGTDYQTAVKTLVPNLEWADRFTFELPDVKRFAILLTAYVSYAAPPIVKNYQTVLQVFRI